MLHWIIAATSSSDSNPFQPVTDFFKSPTWHFLTLMLYFLIVVLWIACAYWVFKDARRRIDDKVIVTVAVLTGLVFGPFGLFIYAIVRPPEYLEDVRERELEMRSLEQRLAEDTRCPFCKTRVKDEFLVCPNCMRRLREVCGNCRRPVEPAWKVCPYCEKQLGRSQSSAFDLV